MSAQATPKEREICEACNGDGMITCVCCGGDGYADEDIDQDEPRTATKRELELLGQERFI